MEEEREAMEIKREHLIEIEWNGPYSLEDLKQGALNDEELDYGLYQVYGRHMVYGSNVLLYIGKADQQTIRKRILQEWWLDSNDFKSIKIYSGRLIGPETPDELTWSNDIDLAEKLLIFAHKPAYNAKNLISIPAEKLEDKHILNWGDHGDLMPEVSGFRWTDKIVNEDFVYYKYET